MVTPLLAAALIVKDEAAALPGCLKALQSLSGLIDHVVVYDTGSTDDTPRLARAAGAVVERGHWDDDFSRARNAAIAMTPARWVVMVDADERLEADPERLRGVLEAGLRRGSEIDALVVPLINIAPDGTELYAAPLVRLFRTDRAHFAGRLHERVEPLRPGAGPLRLSEPDRDLVAIRHFGYMDASVMRGKAERNLALAELEVGAVLGAADPDPQALARALYHRGRTLVSAGRVGAALEDLQRLRSMGVAAVERVWGADVLAQLLLGTGRLDQVPAVVADLREHGVDPQYCSWLSARALLAEEDYATALPVLRSIDHLTDAVGRILDPAPVVEAQMIAAARLGLHDEAAACCIRLMAGLGRTGRFGSLLLQLWGDRPPEWLAELLIGADQGHSEAIAAELAACPPPGPLVAAALAVRAQPATSSPVPIS